MIIITVVGIIIMNQQKEPLIPVGFQPIESPAVNVLGKLIAYVMCVIEILHNSVIVVRIGIESSRSILSYFKELLNCEHVVL